MSPPKEAKKRLIRLKPWLDDLVLRYKTMEYVQADPLQFPYRYQANPTECELVAVLAALFSYGRRGLIIQNIEAILEKMDHQPLAYVKRFDPKRHRAHWRGFKYRFNTEADMIWLLTVFREYYQQHNSLEPCLVVSSDTPLEQRAQTGLTQLINTFLEAVPPPNADGRKGFDFLIAHPKNGGSSKRLHMLLRWLVRGSGHTGPNLQQAIEVDLGLWQQALTPADLMIPLDTHVSKWARHLKLTNRQTDNWQTVTEITAALREMSPDDPIQYDYALFGAGLAGLEPPKL